MALAMAVSIGRVLGKLGNINNIPRIQSINKTFGSKAAAAANVDAISSNKNNNHKTIQAQADGVIGSVPPDPTAGAGTRAGFGLGRLSRTRRRLSIYESRRRRFPLPTLEKVNVSNVRPGPGMSQILSRKGLFSPNVPYKGCPKCSTQSWEEVDRKKKGLPIMVAACRWKAGRCVRCGAASATKSASAATATNSASAATATKSASAATATKSASAARKRRYKDDVVSVGDLASFISYYRSTYCRGHP